MTDQAAAVARLKTLTLLTAKEVGASRAAVFAPQGTGLALVGRWLLDQAALDVAHAGWARYRAELRAGKTVRYAEVVLWPVFSGQDLCAVVYLEKAPATFPDATAQANATRIARWMAQIQVPSPKASYLACGLTHAEVAAEIEGDQLAVLLRFFGGNVSAVARHLGVKRDTVYDRAERYHIDLADFRRRRRRNLSHA